MKKILKGLFVFSLFIVSFVFVSCSCKEAKEQVDLEAVYNELFSDVDLDQITSDLDFKDEVDGIKITYDSNNKEIISDSGKVTRSDKEEVVEVKVTLTYQKETYAGITTFTVLDKLYELRLAIDNFSKNESNYKLVVYSKEEGELYSKVEYQVNGDIVKTTCEYYDGESESSTDFYCVLDGEDITKLYFSINGSFFETTDKNYINDFIYDTDFYYDFYNFNLNYNDFILSDGKYFIKSDKVNDVAKGILGDSTWERFTSFSLELKDGVFYKISASSIIEYEGEYKLDYELIFSDFGKQKIATPDVSPYHRPYVDVSKVYKMNQGDTVEVHAVVMATLGNVFYLDDRTGTIRVRFESSEYIPEGLGLGAYIRVMGTINYQDGLLELVVDNPNAFYSEGILLPQKEISDFSSITKDDISSVVNLSNVYINYNEASIDMNNYFRLTDTLGNEMLLLVSKENASIFNLAFKDIDIDRPLNVSSIVVSFYEDELEFTLSEQIEVIEDGGFIAKTKSSHYQKGTTLEEILSGFEFEYFKEEMHQLSLDDVEVSHDFISGTLGEYEFVFTYLDQKARTTIYIYDTGVMENASFDTLDMVFSKKTTQHSGIAPSGDVNVLVIPIQFTNSDEYDLSLLETAFNGDNSETGWYSLSGYYNETSFGKLNITATITSPYNTNEAYNHSEGKYGREDYKWMVDALRYFDPSIDYSMYDQNEDGYIDCIYFIYLAPFSLKDTADELWWAYNYRYYEEGEVTRFDGLGLDDYIWMSYEFFIRPVHVDKETNENTYVDVNCETVIHETGHALGIDDYYDASKGKNNGGVGSILMMDANQGDFDPFSKAILGWINPTIVSGVDYEGEIGSFTENGDAVFIMKENTGTYFSEYYIISLYNPTKFNALKSDKECGLPSVSGVTIYHIDARLRDNFSEVETIQQIYMFSNSSNTNSPHKLIMLVEADGGGDIENGGYASNSDLFQSGDSVTLSWYDESESFTITFIDVGEDGVTFSIDMNN